MMDGRASFRRIRSVVLRLMAASPISTDARHALATLRWVRRLKPDYDSALAIAALGHDLDRPVTGISESTNLARNADLGEFKRRHARRSARILSVILEAHGCTAALIARVSRIVEAHEFGGDADANVLRDADSLSFFDNNIDVYLRRNGVEKTKRKIRFMYERLSPQAKYLVRKLRFSGAVGRVMENLGLEACLPQRARND